LFFLFGFNRHFRLDKDAMFHHPVPLSLAPDYPTIIKEPMDFSTMMTKLENFEYDAFEAFEYDMNLIFKNCMIYNDVKTPYYKAAQKLQQTAQAQLDSLRSDSRIISMDRKTCTLVPRDGLAETIFSPFVSEEDERLYLEGMGVGTVGRPLDSSATSIAGDMPEMVMYKMGRSSGGVAVGGLGSSSLSAQDKINNHNNSTLSPVEEATKEDVSPTGTGGSSTLEAVSVESELTEFSSRAASRSPGRGNSQSPGRGAEEEEDVVIAAASTATAKGTSNNRRQAANRTTENERVASVRSSPRRSK
jgi:hypothetical protein